MTVSLSDSVKSILQAVGQVAARLRHRHITVDHWLHVLLSQDAAAAILTRCGCDIAHMQRELTEYLELLPAESSRAAADPRPDAAFERVVTRAIIRAQGAGKPAIEIADLLAPILDEPETYAAMLLGAEGLTRIELLRCISHGNPNPPLYPGDVPPTSALVNVLLYNDHYTAMEFVMYVLSVVFSYSEADATALMLQVHQTGHARVGHYPLAMAVTKVEKLRALAKEQGFPLLCTIETIPATRLD